MKKCRLVAYYRVSTKQQGQSGLGLEAQKASVEGHAKGIGCEIVASYTEVESGTDDDRPELAKAIAHAKRVNGRLVVARLCRLSRKMSLVAKMMDDESLDFIAVDQPSANRLTLHVLAAVAEEEARLVSVRTKAALAAAKARGTKLGGVRDGQHALTFEDRQKGQAKAAKVRSENVRQADADVAHRAETLRGEGLSLNAIAQRLTEAGFKTRTGKPFGAVQVMRILRRAEG